MSYLYEIDPKHYAKLLAAEEPKSFGEDHLPGTIPANSSRRSILIGLGGMGVKTIDRIKGVIQEQLQPGWELYIGFLAVDTDREELHGCRYLNREEMMCLSRPGLADMVHAGPAAWPLVWRAIADEAAIVDTVGLGGLGNGAGGKRLVGRLLLHDQAPGQMPFDQQVMDRLRHCVHGVMMPLPVGGGAYDVYVIGSLCGGTGSGTFLDFPVLIRQALMPHSVNSHAMLYLPEVFAPIAPHFAEQHQANAYAALKELDYYQGVPARQGCRETWPYSDPAMPELELDDSTGLFQSVRLVGAGPAAGADSRHQAIETVRMYLHHELADYAPPFIPAAPVPAGAEGEDGFLCHYTAGNAARAALPKDVLRAYVIGKACKDAGLTPVSDAEHAMLLAAGAPFLPFLGQDQYQPAAQLNAQAQQLLQPLTQFLRQFYAARDFSYENNLKMKPTWEEIRSGEADSVSIRAATDREIDRLTSCDVVQRLREQVQEQYRLFRENVKQYVEQYGPISFVNLFEGRGKRDTNSDHVRGIHERIAMLRDGLHPETGSPIFWLSPARAQEYLREATHEIQSERGGIMAIMHRATGRQDDQTARWCQAYDDFANARIAEERRNMMLGRDGIMNRYFLEPAVMLTQQLYTFGRVLETMTDIYTRHGAALDSFAAFRGCARDAGGVNIGGLFPGVYEELRRQMDLLAAQHNPFLIRQSLVADFFDDPNRWMEVDDDNLARGPYGELCLRDSGRPASARHAFDRCLAGMIAGVPGFPVSRLYQMAQNHGISTDAFAHGILTELAPLSRITLPDVGGTEIVYPAQIHTGYPALSAAIQNAAQNIYGWGVSFRLSYDEESITLRWSSMPLEISRLQELPQWKAAYEHRLLMPGNGLHGCRPDVRVTRGPDGIETRQEMAP